jgi:hypothetical protein
MKLSETQCEHVWEYVNQTVQQGRPCALCKFCIWEYPKEVFKLTAFQEGREVAALPLRV